MKRILTLSYWLLTIAFGAWGTSVNAQTSGDWTDLLTYIQDDCAEDTTGVDEACAWLPAVEACSAGDSLACDSIWATWSGYLTDAVDDSDSTSNDVSDAIDTILGELQAECDADTSGTAIECDLIPLATACLGGDSLACIEWGSAWSAYENSGDDSNDDGDLSGTDDSSDTDDSDDAFDTDSIDDDSDDWASILVDLQSDCAEDTTGLDAACDLALTLEACLGGDSLACTDWESAWMTYSDDHGDDHGDDDDDDEWGDDDDDEWDDDDDDEWDDDDDDEWGDDDDDDDWENYGGSLETVLAYLQADCAEDTTGLDEACTLAAIAESCLAGDSLACADWEAAWMAYEDNDDDEWDDEEDDDDYEEDDDDDEEDDDDDEEDDDDDEWDDDDDNDEWENEGGSLESILAYLQADCAEDTTGLDESCALAAIAESCLAGDSLACVDWDAAWMGYESDEEDEDDDEWEEEDDDNDSDDDGLSDDDEILYATDANSADTDGDGLNDGDEVLLFNLSPTSADTDGNGIPDPVDLVYSMLPQVNACPSDINRDGTVSVADMLLFLVDFGTTCPQ